MPARRCSSAPPTRPTPTGYLAPLELDLDERRVHHRRPTGHTSAHGVWAAGNVVDPRVQVITSAGAGSAAAIAINADLVQEDLALAVNACPA